MERKYLEEWRKGKYWSIGQLSDVAEVNKSVISRIESGKAGCRLETAKKIADALGVLPEQIIDFDKMFQVKSDRQPAFNRLAAHNVMIGVVAPIMAL
jgi:ribosome-binding protein aMBF1 (putative translation factor)